MALHHSTKETETTIVQHGKTVTKRTKNRQTDIPSWFLFTLAAVLAIFVISKLPLDEWLRFIIWALAKVIN